jgi:hypothetical protein
MSELVSSPDDLHLISKSKTGLKSSFDCKRIDRNQTRRVFLIGILCGVMMAAAVTFAIAIPANNIHWHVEIVKRGNPRRGTQYGSVAKFDFWAKSKNLVSGIQ